MGINIVKVVLVIHIKATPAFITALSKSREYWENMNKDIQKHTFQNAYMMAILHPLKLSRLNGLDLVRKNFAKNVLEFVVFIFVSYIHHIF